MRIGAKGGLLRALCAAQVLGVHLLHEVSKSASSGQSSSSWDLYLRELPKDYTCLAYFAPAAVTELQVRPAHSFAAPFITVGRTMPCMWLAVKHSQHKHNTRPTHDKYMQAQRAAVLERTAKRHVLSTGR